MTIRISSLNLRYIKANREDKQEISTIEIIIIREIIKISVGQIAEIEEHQTEIEVNVDKIIEEDCVVLIIIEMIIEEIISEICKIIEVKILDVNTKGVVETIIFKEVEVGLGKDNIQVILEGVTEIIVSLDQVQKPLLIEIGLGDINVGCMIILLRIVQCYR